MEAAKNTLHMMNEKTFKVNVEVTINLNDLAGEMMDLLYKQLPSENNDELRDELIKQTISDIEEAWSKSDLELTEALLEGITDSIPGSKVKATGFRRGEGFEE